MAVEDCRQLTLRNRADLVDRLDSKPHADDVNPVMGPSSRLSRRTVEARLGRTGVVEIIGR